MAHFGKDHLDDFNGSRYIHIRSAEQNENFTVYVITVTVGPYSWTVKHRYSEFNDLHEKLCASCKLDKGLLPPKKIFGNQTEAFIKKRQKELEIYLQTILFYLAQHVPSCLAYFLDFDKYEIHGITQSLAEDLYSRGEGLLQCREKYVVTSLQLYSLTERLKLPEPTCDSGDIKKDLGHILDFITRAKYVKVVGGSKPVGTSNILMNKLVFDLTLFKSLQTLEICGCNFRLIKGLETVKQTLTQLAVHESSSSLKEMLLQDCPHWRAEDGSVIVDSWDNVTTLDLRNNSISDLHECIQLMPNVEDLNLSRNQLEQLQNLQWLSQLTVLDLSYNQIRHLDSLHTKLGNVKVVRLAHNQLDSLRGFTKLYSLQTLDVSHNNIMSIDEVLHISQLPCMENFVLTGNTVTSSLDYRTKTLEMFGERVREVKLDGQVSSEKELSTVAVLQALRKARNTKAPRRIGQNKNASAISLSDAYHSLCGSFGDQGDRSSPGLGHISSSVPTALAIAGDESSLRSVSPYSQDSVSSFNSTHDLDVSSPPCTSGTSSSNFTIGAIDTVEEESEPTPGLIPEAHPFDLSSPVITVSKPSPSLLPATNDLSFSTAAAGKSPDSRLPPEQTRDSALDAQDSSDDVPSTFTVTTTATTSTTTNLPQKRSSNWTYNAADLAKFSDQNFVLWLTKQLSSSEEAHSPAATSSFPHHSHPPSSKAVIIDTFWCFVQPLSTPDSFISCCAILTSSTLFVEKLVAVESTFPGMPDMKPLYILPLKNIQQLVVGPCHSFLRLEEAFVGRSGTFTLYNAEPQEIQRLSQKVLSLCQKLNFAGDLDCVDLTVDSDLLKRVVRHEDELTGMASDRLVLTIPIRLRKDQPFHFLLLSEYRVYCVNLKCALWPPPCFESLPENSLHFEIVHDFSVTDKLVDLKIHPDEEVEGDDFLLENSVKTQSFTAPVVDFVLHPLSFRVETKEEASPKLPNLKKEKSLAFKYLFPSSAFRDLFLDRLSNLRAEQASCVLPSVREEPEGGNEQLSNSLTLADAKNQENQNNSCSSSPSKTSSTLREPNATNDSASSSTPIPYHTTSAKDKSSHTQTTSSVAESFRSCPSSSEESFQSVIESEGVADHALAEDRSSSPKDDLSLSPTSNFSRASISPPADQGQGQTEGAKATLAGRLHDEAQGEVRRGTEALSDIRHPNYYPDAAMRADSLPSSFDWKKFYFTIPPSDSGGEMASRLSKAKSDEEVPKSANSTFNKAEQTSSPPTTLNLNLESSQSSSNSDINDATGESETELDGYLKTCIRSFDLIYPLSTKMKPLCLMSGGELRKFFHASIAQNTHLDVTEGLAEEIHHVLWAMVIPYTNPKQEITTLIMLSTYAVYLVSDTGVKVNQNSRPSWMTHSRNQSDSAVAWKTDKESVSSGRKTVKPYVVLKYKDVHQIHVGLFDQCVRLTGYNENNVFTIATRDSQVTETLVEKLKQVLSLSVSSPMLERSYQEMEQDFYRDVSQRTKTTIEGLVYTHPSQVNFVYPGEEAVADVLYLVREKAASASPASDLGASGVADKSHSLWFYIQCYLLPSDDCSLSATTKPRTILMTSTHFAVAEEDAVTYPLPDFVRGLPENPCHEILDCHAIESLKRVHLYNGNPHWLGLTFVEDQPELLVDVNMQHFAQAAAGREKQKVAPEVNVRFYIQSVMERDKLVQMLEKLWKQQVSQVGRILDIQRV